MSKSFKRIIGAALAVCIVLACGLLAGDAKVKATDGEEIPEVAAVEEPAPPVVEEVIVEQTEEYTVAEMVEVPAEEAASVEEEPEAPAEEENPEEQAEEEEAFNVEEAYRYYITLSDSEKQAYLDSLSAENREALLRFIEQMEAEAAKEEEVKAEEPETEGAEKTVELWYEFPQGTDAPDGTEVTICSRLTGYGENVHYQWMYSTDGVNWNEVPDGNGSTFTFPLNDLTRTLWWDLIVTEG